MRKKRGQSEHPTNGKIFLDRRQFLLLAAASGAAATGCEVPVSSNALEQSLPLDADLPVDASLTAVRKEDFVLLRFDFVNFVPDSKKNVLKRKAPGPAYVVVNFQS